MVQESAQILLKDVHKDIENAASARQYEAARSTAQANGAIRVEDIQFGPRIGEGCFGIIYEGQYKNAPCAIKKLKRTLPGHESAAYFREIEMLKRLRHHNIICYYGSTEPTPHPCIVIELLSLSLCQAIHTPEKYTSMSNALKLRIYVTAPLEVTICIHSLLLCFIAT